MVAVHHHASTEKPSEWLKVTQESVVELRFKLGALTLAKDGGNGLQPLPSKEALDQRVAACLSPTPGGSPPITLLRCLGGSRQPFYSTQIL